MSTSVASITIAVRHFVFTFRGLKGTWERIDAEDTRQLPGAHKDKHRRYAVRELPPRQGEPRAWTVWNGDNGQRYTVRELEPGFLSCNCPAGRRPQRRSTTTTPGICVHCDLIAALHERDGQRMVSTLPATTHTAYTCDACEEPLAQPGLCPRCDRLCAAILTRYARQEAATVA